MLAILSPILGIFGSLLPHIVKIFAQRQELQHELAVTQLQMEAAKQGAKLQLDLESVKADSAEGESLRSHDASIDGGKFVNALRGLVRPFITYIFFFLFCAVKIAAAYVMIQTGQSIPEMLKAVWDTETMALFSTVIAFWFGSRTLEKMDSRVSKKK
jgi:hypothetical protein